MTIMGANVDNDGYIAFDLLEPNHSRILCMTNYSGCCTSDSGTLGNWSFPDGTFVPRRRSYGEGDAPYFAVTRSSRVVRLFRVDNNTAMTSSPIRGRFCCEVPNEQGETQNYYINIRMSCMIVFMVTVVQSNLLLYSSDIGYMYFFFYFSGHWSSDCTSIWF